MAEQPQPNQVQVKINDDMLKAVYANGVNVSYTPEEFVLDFMTVFPPAGIVSSRVVMSPGHMKRLASVLSDNIKRFEEQHGEIKANVQNEHKFGFRTE